MKKLILLVGAAALAFSPSLATAQKAGGNGSKSAAAATPDSPTGNGGGYNHMNSPQQTTGQPNQSCQTINGGNTGPSYPGNTSTAPGSAFNETNGHAGGQYAGSQPQNSRNTASVSQYDVACANQPH